MAKLISGFMRTKAFWVSFFGLFHHQLIGLPLLTAPPTPNTPQQIWADGYPVEKHTVTTDDGYILTHFRIPYGKTLESGPRNGKPCVLIVHGILSSSFQWLLQPVEKALPYQLADQGYDVWLANSRGSSYSIAHTYLSTSSREYWMFSWEEMGLYDLPATIDYMLRVTGKSRIFYIGHSQGTTQFFVMASLRPEYNNKIVLMSAFAPVALTASVKGPFRSLSIAAAKFSRAGGSSSSGFKAIPQFLLDLIHTYAPLTCTSELLAYGLCENLMLLIGGLDPPQTNITLLPLVDSVLPDSSSINEFLHYGQEVQSGHFARFDYGSKHNIAKYGTPCPPDFNIRRITVPIALYWAYNDWIAHPLDVVNFGHRLPASSLVRNYSVPFNTFNHMDFIIAINASEWVYDPTIQLMNSYLSKQYFHGSL